MSENDRKIGKPDQENKSENDPLLELSRLFDFGNLDEPTEKRVEPPLTPTDAPARTGLTRPDTEIAAPQIEGQATNTQTSAFDTRAEQGQQTTQSYGGSQAAFENAASTTVPPVETSVSRDASLDVDELFDVPDLPRRPRVEPSQQTAIPSQQQTVQQPAAEERAVFARQTFDTAPQSEVSKTSQPTRSTQAAFGYGTLQSDKAPDPTADLSQTAVDQEQDFVQETVQQEEIVAYDNATSLPDQNSQDLLPEPDYQSSSTYQGQYSASLNRDQQSQAIPTMETYDQPQSDDQVAETQGKVDIGLGVINSVSDEAEHEAYAAEELSPEEWRDILTQDIPEIPSEPYDAYAAEQQIADVEPQQVASGFAPLYPVLEEGYEASASSNYETSTQEFGFPVSQLAYEDDVLPEDDAGQWQAERGDDAAYAADEMGTPFSQQDDQDYYAEQQDFGAEQQSLQSSSDAYNEPSFDHDQNAGTLNDAMQEAGQWQNDLQGERFELNSIFNDADLHADNAPLQSADNYQSEAAEPQDYGVQDQAPAWDDAYDSNGHTSSNAAAFDHPMSDDQQNYEALDDIDLNLDEAELSKALDDFELSLDLEGDDNLDDFDDGDVANIDTVTIGDEIIEETQNLDLPDVVYENQQPHQAVSDFEREFDQVFNESEVSNNETNIFGFETETTQLGDDQEFDRLSSNVAEELGAQSYLQDQQADSQAQFTSPTPQVTKRREFMLQPDEPKSSAKFVVAIGGLVVVALVGAAWYLWSGNNAQQQSSETVVIHADPDPVRVPADTQQQQAAVTEERAIYNQVQGRAPAQPEQQNLVDNSEQPADLASIAATSSQQDAYASAQSIDRALQAASRQQVPTRSVDTVVVRSDGSIVSTPSTQQPTSTASSTPSPTGDNQAQTASSADDDISALISSAESDDSLAAIIAAAEETIPQTGNAGTTPSTSGASTAPASSNQAASQSAPLAAAEFYVQISSQPSREAAEQSWRDAQRNHAQLLQGLTPDIREAQIANRGTYYRVRIPATSRAHADRLCADYLAAGGSCFVTR